MYVIIEFVDEGTIAVSHIYWIETEDQEVYCYWPGNAKASSKLIHNELPDKALWKKYKVRVLSTTDNLQTARKRAQRAEGTSNVESEVEDRVRKRKLPRRYSPDLLFSSDASSEDEEENGPQEKTSRQTQATNSMTLPTPPSFSGIPKGSNADVGDHGLPEKVNKQMKHTTKVNVASPSRFSGQPLECNTDVGGHEKGSKLNKHTSAVSMESPLGSCGQSAEYNTGFQMAVVRKLDSIIESLSSHEKILKAIESTSSRYSTSSPSLLEDILPGPLNTTEDIKDFDKKLEEDTFAKMMVKLMRPLEGRRLAETVKGIFKKLGTNRLWSNYSLKGMRKKLALTELKHLYRVIIKACLQSHPGCNVQDIDLEIIECLKHAPGKSGGYRYKGSVTRRPSDVDSNSPE